MTIPALTDFNCSVAKTLSILGERWTLLIVRDLFFGIRRFSEIQADLGVAPNILSERLTSLVEEGIVERHRYSERRSEYRLTEKGLELQPVLLALLSWGDRYQRSARGRPREIVHLDCGHVCEQVAVCSQCGGELHPRNTQTRPGPGATAAERERHGVAA